MFKKAAKMKLRFTTTKGNLLTEDLWDLPLTGECSLNSIAIDLHNTLEGSTISFVDPDSTETCRPTVLKLDIVKAVIADRIAMINVSKNAELKRSRNAKIEAIIATKEDEALSSKTVEDLRALLVS